MRDDVEKILIPRDKIARRVRELADAISADHAKLGADAEITLVPILTGAMIFCADLMRHIPDAMKIGLLTVSSYPGYSLTSQGAEFIQKRLGNVKGHHILIIDDILDSGSTLRLVMPAFAELEVASVRTCVLLRKDRPAAKDMKVDYVGFDIPDEFVVGYGLDFNDYYRNLPDVVTLKPSVLEARP